MNHKKFLFVSLIIVFGMIAFTVFLVTDQSDNHSDKEAKNTEAIIDLTEVSTEKKETGEGNREWDNSSTSISK